MAPWHALLLGLAHGGLAAAVPRLLAGEPVYVTITTTKNVPINLREVQALDEATAAVVPAMNASFKSGHLVSGSTSYEAGLAVDGDLGDGLAHSAAAFAVGEYLRITYPAGTVIGTIVVHIRWTGSAPTKQRIEGCRIELEQGAATLWPSTFEGVRGMYTFQLSNAAPVFVKITKIDAITAREVQALGAGTASCRPWVPRSSRATTPSGAYPTLRGRRATRSTGTTARRQTGPLRTLDAGMPGSSSASATRQARWSGASWCTTMEVAGEPPVFVKITATADEHLNLREVQALDGTGALSYDAELAIDGDLAAGSFAHGKRAAAGEHLRITYPPCAAVAAVRVHNRKTGSQAEQARISGCNALTLFGPGEVLRSRRASCSP